MKVAIDGTLLREQGQGVSRFLERFLWAYHDLDQEDEHLVVFTTRDAQLPELPDDPRIRYESVSVPSTLLWEVRGFDHALDQVSADVALSLSDRVRASRPLVLYLFEVPDHRRKLQRETRGLYQRVSDWLTGALFERTIRGADRVVTSSEATREDLAMMHGFDTTHVDVVYPAPAPHFRPSSEDGELDRWYDRYDAADGYFLHFSSDNDPRDNTETVLDAYARYLDEGGSVDRLVVGGIEAFRSFGLDERAEDLGLASNIRFTGFLRGNDLVRTYQAATAYVDPSWYEGFGFQVAEAMACGTAVVCSGRTSLPEVTGDAAIHVAPDDPAELAAAMHQVGDDETARRSLEKRATDRISRFNWSRTTRELLAAIREVAR